MKILVVVILLLFLFVQIQADGQQTFLSGMVTLSWNVTSDSLIMTMTGKTTGWVGMGAGSNMIGSSAVIGWVSGGQLTIAEYVLDGQVPSQIRKQTHQDLTSTSGSESGGVTTIQFTRKLNTGDSEDGIYNTGDATTNILVAYGNVDAIQQHVDRGAFSIKFGSAGGNSGPDGSVVAIAAPSNSKRIAHAFFVPFAFALGFPSGALVARHLKSFSWWWPLHRSIQSFSIICMLTGFFIIVAQVSQENGQHFGGYGGPHKIIGLTAIILAFLQPINAAFRPDKTAPNRPYWFWLHRLAALSANVLGIAALILGLSLGVDYGILTSDQRTSWTIAVLVVDGTFFIVALLPLQMLFGGGNNDNKNDNNSDKSVPMQPMPPPSSPQQTQIMPQSPPGV